MGDSNFKNPCQILVVAAALIDASGAVLVQKRRNSAEHGGLWEFPGGKVEPGESPEMALVRELGEELGIWVRPENLAPATFSSTEKDGRNLLLLLYTLCEWDGEIEGKWAEMLAWCPLNELSRLAMPPADVPLIVPLQNIVRRGRLEKPLPGRLSRPPD